jgi:ABC-type transport system involved in cytochrome c biogenesis permease subunit
MNRCWHILSLLLCLSGFAPSSSVHAAEVIDIGPLPVQDGGRVKPLSTKAGFLLLRSNGSRTVRLEDVRRFDPSTWAWETWSDPKAAQEWPMLLVSDSDTLGLIGIQPPSDKKKRDRWSIAELLPHAVVLDRRASSIREKDKNHRSTQETQILDLAANLNATYDFLLAFDWVHWRHQPAPDDPVRLLLDDQDDIDAITLLDKGPVLVAALRELHGMGLPPSDPRVQSIEEALGQVMLWEQVGGSVAWLPPAAGSNSETWRSFPDLVRSIFREGRPLTERDRDILRAAFAAFAAPADQASAAVEAWLTTMHQSTDARTSGKIYSEVRYYQADLLSHSLTLYIIAFLIAAWCWARPQSVWPRRGLWAFSVAATVLLVAAITWRCILRERPPVSTLYETALFIGGVIAILGLIIEAIQRRLVAISSAVAMAGMNIFLAFSYEYGDGQDTMPSLVAVLDTNFWLATHVTTVTIGYAAGLLAAGLAHVYLLRQLFLPKGNTDRELAMMIYGTVCFGLLFALIGTILGGIWANESWGRFWGWDPKENGALMIVLGQTAMLHGRMAGWLRGRGFAFAAIVVGMIVAFSWWHVNLLGVGLHSYGFTSGIQTALYSFYAIEVAVMLVFAGALIWRGSR